jgi:enamine deaminase RidA (YjgF/YER057c/UK114 family)
VHPEPADFTTQNPLEILAIPPGNAGLSHGISHRKMPNCKHRMNETRDGFSLNVQATDRASFTEYHLTGTLDGTGDPRDVADRLLSHVAATIAERRIQPIQEKFYGLPRIRADILKRREAHYCHQEVDLTVPVTWVAGIPLREGDFVGLQVWGVTPRVSGTSVTTVENPVTGRGRLFSGPGFRMLHLPFVRGLNRSGTLTGDDVAQADKMFTNVRLGLEAHGLTYRNVVRTWIYLARLLEWYGELNQVRNAHYQPAGLGLAGGPAFPASTGIQGRYDDEECMMDVLAFESTNRESAAAIPIHHSPRQGQSFNYGSAFSRGMNLEIEGTRTIHISGTASINAAGKSIHIGDAELQSLETMMCIAAILEKQGGSLENIVSATLFCKTPEAWQAWDRVSRLLKIPAFPKICVLADVCRDDLLVEMEAVAVI